MLRFAAAEGGGADDEGAVGNRFGDRLKLFGAGEQRRGTDGGTGFAEGQLVRIDDAKMKEAEIAHGAGGGADVERVARGNEDDAETVGLRRSRQGKKVYNRKGEVTGDWWV